MWQHRKPFMRNFSSFFKRTYRSSSLLPIAETKLLFIAALLNDLVIKIISVKVYFRKCVTKTSTVLYCFVYVQCYTYHF